MTARAANRRIRVLAVLFLCAFAIILVRTTWVQLVHGATYRALATRQQRETITLPAGRGTILDRTGEPLAIGEQSTTVYADPVMVKNPQKAAVVTGRILGLDPNKVYNLLRTPKTRFVFIARQADPVKAAALEKKGLPGVGFYGEEKRTYPQGRVAAQVLGYAGTDNKGLEGLERSLEKKLRGRAGAEIVIKDPYGRAIDVVRARAERPGKSVTLTLDHQIQATTENILLDTVHRFDARGGTAIVMDVSTGSILAMANAPTINANRFGRARVDLHRNRAVTDQYEPGSTFKIVTIAAALQDGVVTPTTAFDLAPTINVADRTIHEAHERGTERMTVREILSRSSNIGTITIAEQLGSRSLASWIARFGFGARTGVDFPGESPGQVHPLSEWSGSTIGTVPIGQGIAVTPMQMISAYAAIGNGGIMPVPHLVEKIGGKSTHVGKGHRIVSERTAHWMMGMFRDVVLEGTGTEAAIPGYTVAGKTGTAQKPENGGYARDKYVASFVGLVPAMRPRLAILVMVDEPHGSIFGGEVAAPAFRDIAKFTLPYLEVPPDAPQGTEPGQNVALGLPDPA